MGIVMEIGSEWVALPILEPWPVEEGSLERVNQIVHLTSNASLEHIQDDEIPFIKVSFGNVESDVHSRIDSENGGKQKMTNVEKHSEKIKSDLPNCTSGFHEESGQAPASEKGGNYFGPQLESHLPDSEPTIASILDLTRNESILFPQLPTTVPTNSGENYPNRSYTYLDPLIESLLLKVHNTLISHTSQPAKQKIHYLQSLQNNILNQIWKRSQRLWVVEGTGARGSDVVSFPSMEGALLTISFLTFAVFLIKIVKQFINGMQGNSTMMIQVPMNPTRVRLKRDDMASQAEHVLRIIEEFHLQHARGH